MRCLMLKAYPKLLFDTQSGFMPFIDNSLCFFHKLWRNLTKKIFHNLWKDYTL